MSAQILITGGTGLVGQGIKYAIETEPVNSHFGKRDGEEWIFIGSSEADLRNKGQTEKLFEKYQPTHVIHLAARVGGVFANMARKLDFLRDNLLINDNVLHTAHEFKVKKVISCLSTCVYPDKVEYPLDETKIHLGLPHESNFGYSHAKRLVDIQNRAYKEQFGDNFTSAIPTSVFGPHDNFDLESAHVLPALIHRCYLSKTNNTPFVVWGSGKALRQFIYSRDLAKLFDEEITIKQAADAVVKAVGFKGAYQFDTTKSDGQFRKPATNKKLLGLLKDTGFRFTPFDRALDEMVQWFLQNYMDARTGKP
ncbi:epimerase-domain-containing protein [Dichomitus squalens]|nr:epimerase-domain-containing protein [Dichomitus squalens]